MFFAIALAIWVAMHVYVISRVRSVPFVRARVPRRTAITAGAVLGSTYVIARILEETGARAAGVVLEWVGAEWMGALVIALGCFFVADIATCFGLLWRQRAPAVRTAALVASIILTIAAVANALRAPVIREYEVRVANLPPERDGAVIALISDLHLGTLTSDAWLSGRIAQIEALRPDLVLVAGDLVEGDGTAERETPAALSRLRAPLCVWAVPGNHERHGSGADAVLERRGIHVLRDRSVRLAPGLFLAGVDTAGHTRVAGRGLVERALAATPRDSTTILLSHYPEQVEKATRLGADLMLSGHTHAGQIWPFNYFVRIAYRYTGGRYDAGGMPLIVCRGTGTWGPRMRLFRPNEIVRIVLRRS